MRLIPAGSLSHNGPALQRDFALAFVAARQTGWSIPSIAGSLYARHEKKTRTRARYWFALAFAASLLLSPGASPAQSRNHRLSIGSRDTEERRDVACADDRSISLITIADAGHQWPGAVARHPLIERLLRLDPPSSALNATQALWRFFESHTAR